MKKPKNDEEIIEFTTFPGSKLVIQMKDERGILIKSIQFEDGSYKTNDEREIKFLRNYAAFPNNNVVEKDSDKAVYKERLRKMKKPSNSICPICGKDLKIREKLIAHKKKVHGI